MAREESILRFHAGLSQLSNLRTAQSCHGDLGELGQEQSTIRVGEFLTVNHDTVGVVTHDFQDGETKLGAGVGIGTLPHVTRGGRGCIRIHAHAWGLNALARETVEGTWRCHGGGCLQDNVAIHTGSNSANFAGAWAGIDAGALDDEVHLRAGQYGAEHIRGPFSNGNAIEAGYKLRNRGSPHAVDDNAVVQASQARGGAGDVDWVAVASDHGKWVHGCRCGHGELVAKRSRGIGDVLSGIDWLEVLLAGTSDDGETLFQASQLSILEVSAVDVDRD